MANAQLRTLVAELEKWGYMANVGFHAYSVPIETQITGNVRPVLLVVFGAFAPTQPLTRPEPS